MVKYVSILSFLRRSLCQEGRATSTRHARKITGLKRDQTVEVHVLDESKVVVNLSSHSLTDAEILLLRRGLAFSVPPRHLDSTDIRTSFESI